MTSEEQKIIDIKVKYEDAIYGIIRFQEKLNDLKKTQQQLDEELKNGTISWNEWATQSEPQQRSSTRTTSAFCARRCRTTSRPSRNRRAA